MGVFQGAEDRLAGEPDAILTGLLIGVAIVAVVVALTAPRLLKVAVLAWFVLP